MERIPSAGPSSKSPDDREFSRSALRSPHTTFVATHRWDSLTNWPLPFFAEKYLPDTAANLLRPSGRGALTALPAVLLADELMLIRYACPNVATVFGYPAESLVGQSLTRLFGQKIPTPTSAPAGSADVECEITTQQGHSRSLMVSVRHAPVGGGILVYTCRDISENKWTEAVFHSMARGTASVGDQFFASLARELATALGARYALVDEIVPEAPQRVRTLAVWADGKLAENITYDLSGTPCEIVLRESVCFYPQDVQRLFPEDTLLVEMNVVSYIGTALFGSAGQPLGLTAVMHDHPMRESERAKSILTVFAARAAAEIERLGTERALRRSEERLRAIVEDQTEMIVRWKPDGRCTFANGAYAKSIGRRAEEVVEAGHFPPVEGAASAGCSTRLAALLPDQPVATHVVAASGASPQARWEEWTDHGLFDARGQLVEVQSTGRDITIRRRAEAARAESEERFHQLTGAIQEVFWMTDPASTQMLYVSPAYETIWGRTCESLYAAPRSWLEAIHPQDRSQVLIKLGEMGTTGSYDEEFRILRPDGKERWIHDQAFPVREASGQITRVVGVASDVTERRQLQEDLRQAQKMEAIGLLAGGVAHDFNNILAAIILQSQLAEMSAAVSQETRQALHNIKDYAERAAHLTRQLLLFSRRQVLQPQELDLNESVAQLARMLHRIIGEDINLQLQLHSIPLIVRADPGMLDQVIMNLAVNARDAMPRGGRLLITTTPQVVDAAGAQLHPEAAPGHYVCLRVADTGIGIAPDVLPRIFEPFYTTKGPGKGTGLGLATVYGIVQQHRGWIQVQSELEHGTTFQVLLPVVETPQARPVAVAPAIPRGGTETILLAEDNASLRVLIRTALERFGYRVLEAASGDEARRRWEGRSGEASLLLTDLVMPGELSGQQLARCLQQENPRLKVIYISGYNSELAGHEIALHSGEIFLPKPFDAQQIIETVRRSLDA